MKLQQKSEVSSQDEIRAAGLKLTPARLHVLEILKKDHCLLTIDEIVRKLSRSSAKSADWTTVYRTLLTFADAGLVTPTTLVDGALRYEYSHPSEDDHAHHHHHVSCKKCGKIEAIEACEIAKLEKQVLKMGFKDLSHRLEFTGICEACQ